MLDHLEKPRESGIAVLLITDTASDANENRKSTIVNFSLDKWAFSSLTRKVN